MIPLEAFPQPALIAEGWAWLPSGGAGWLAPMAAAVADPGVAAPEQAGPAPGELFALLLWVVELGLASLLLGMLLCLYRIWRGPTLADRVLASDTLSLHVVGLVILLTIYLGDLTYFDAVLGIAIVGFASVVGFAQYIGDAPVNPGEEPARPEEVVR